MWATRSLPHRERLVAVIVAAATLSAGVKLVELSMQQHAVHARELAQSVVLRLGRALDSQLQALTDRARRRAAASGVEARGATLASLRAEPGTFCLIADAPGQPADPAQQQWIDGIVQELTASERDGTTSGPALLGPMRLGSQWIVVARAPLPLPMPHGALRQPGWAIAYEDVEHLLHAAAVGEVNRAGYDVELSQLERTNGRSQVFFATRTGVLAQATRQTIHFPATFPHRLPEGDWSIAVRPRAGWYPFTELAADAAILGLGVWLLTLIAYEVTRSSRRWQAALEASKHRQRSAQARLMSEVEKREDLQKSLDHARYHDAFTGLPNRRYFMDQLDRGLRQARIKRRYRLAVILVGIDRFKLIRETMGHTAGDELMLQVARRFERTASPVERVVSRWSADQFAVLLCDLHSIDTALSTARMLQDAFAAPFELRKQRIAVTARFGVTCADSGLHRAEDVVREADIALSAARADRTVVPYTEKLCEQAMDVVHLEADLHVALQRRELRLLFQPIVHLYSGQIVGSEALLRWNHPVEGLLTPDRFLTIAEEAGLMAPITRWTIRRACKVAASWSHRLLPGTKFYVAVNLPAQVVEDLRLAEYVARALEETGIAPELLRFEVTEGSLISKVGPARELLERLHQMGISLVLDDFGTGYSSLSYLQLFPFDCLKIDRSFVSRLATDGRDCALLRAIVQMASSLGLQTVAEGIESQTVAQLLHEIGCNFGQGFWRAPALEGEELLRRLKSQEHDEVLELPAQSA